MPELPEVETTLRGISPHLISNRIVAVEIRERRLRWPVPEEVDGLVGARILGASRRAKYLLLDVGTGTVIMHLGMSGSLRVNSPDAEWRKHDHIAFRLSTGSELRFHDPRRFGCVLFCSGDPAQHKLMRELGPEPLGDEFTPTYLASVARGKKVAIKQFVMNSHIVVGVGNIYACEALFISGIHPLRETGRVSAARLGKLVAAVKVVLGNSIRMGGTTLRDFLREDGEPGYFKQSLKVYGREGEPCHICGSEIRRVTQGGRSTFYCPKCQR